MKIVELLIDELESIMGFDAVALVSSPAHEANFHAFDTDDVDDAIAFQIIKQAFLELTETEDVYELEIGDYQTRHYDMCPGASALYKRIESEEVPVDMGLAIRAAKLQDALFYLEKHTIKEMGKASFEDVVSAQNIASEIMVLARMMGLEQEHQYIYGHVQAIRDLAMQNMDVDVASLPNFINEGSGSVVTEGLSQEFSYYDDLPSKVLDRLIEKLVEVGISKESLLNDGYEVREDAETFGLPTQASADPEGSTVDTSGDFKILYEYTGPKDSKNRDFCSRLLDLNLLFRKEDIQKMTLTGANSEEFGYYDIFSYKGSFGCRHNWRKKYVYQRKDNNLLGTVGLLLADRNEFSAEKYSFALDGDQQMVIGPLMIPDKLIFRVDENHEPYYVFFSKETIKQIAEKMMKEKLLDRVNLEHDPESPIESFMVENWVVGDRLKDKQQAYGFDYPVGTWMGMYKVESPLHWQMVKEGKLKGFSIEGYFIDKLIQK